MPLNPLNHRPKTSVPRAFEGVIVNSSLEGAEGRFPVENSGSRAQPVGPDGGLGPLYIGQMICFCAERFPWRRIWQIPGGLLLPGLNDMATRALLYRRPAEPSTILVKHGSQVFAVRVRRHRRARRYTLRIHPTDREAILTMPPRGTIAEAREFAQLHGGWIAARLGRLPKAAPFQVGTLVPLRGVPHRIVHRSGERGTVWTETRDSGEQDHLRRRRL